MEEKKINLSYFMTTFNKLPYLKIVIEDLINNLQPDEEIVIADGGSTDGTMDFLRDLFNRNKIQYLLSAKDQGEAHGANRAMLACTGKLMKWINDDDVFCYPSIKECKAFMLANEEYGVLGADGFDNFMGKSLVRISHQTHFKKWKEKKEPFGFYGPGLMIRNSSLPLIGLFNCLIGFVDYEYTFKITSLPVKMAWFSKPVFVRIINPESNTLKLLKRRELEEKLNDIYREMSTGLPSQSRNIKRKFQKVKIKVYDILHSRRSTPNLVNYNMPDIEQLYKAHKNTLYTAYESESHDPLFVY